MPAAAVDFGHGGGKDGAAISLVEGSHGGEFFQSHFVLLAGGRKGGGRPVAENERENKQQRAAQNCLEHGFLL